MWNTIDNTYNDIRKKSLAAWLNEMENHGDINVRGGVKLTWDYISHLESEIERLNKANSTKDEYLKKLKKRG